MKNSALLILVALFFSQSMVFGADTDAPSEGRLAGVDAAECFSMVTGVAISPLLGVCGVGAWRYFHTPEAQRHLLPWFSQPFVWGVGFSLVGLCFLKDLVGTVMPPLLKKPLDFAELFENKISALVASSAFVPFLATHMGQHAPTELPMPPGADGFGFDIRFITIPLAVLGFLIVWLACHAVNVLIALCPFGFIDGILKLLKTALLSVVVASTFISPFLGAAVSLAILVVAALIAPWAFRLTVFGTFFGIDVLFPSRGRRNAEPTEPHAFLARRIDDAPVRAYGRLARDQNGAVTFTYRPWLILPRRVVRIPSGNVAISKGILFPSLLHSFDDQQRHRILVMFLPRYRAHEQTIAEHFAIVDLRDSPLIKGFKAVRVWFADTINLGKSKYTEFRAAQLR